MTLKRDEYYLIEDKGVIQDKAFDTPEEAITHLNLLASADTGVDSVSMRVQDREIRILTVEVVDSVYPAVDIVIKL